MCVCVCVCVCLCVCVFHVASFYVFSSNPVCICPLPMLHPYCPLGLDYPNVLCSVPIMKILTMECYAAACYFFPLTPKCLYKMTG